MNILSRFGQEVRDSLAATSARRLAWDTVGRAIPDFTFGKVRVAFLRFVGCDVRWQSGVFGFVNLVGPKNCPANLRIAPGAAIGPGVTFGLDASITIGRNASIGPRAVLYTATHALGPGSKRMDPFVKAAPIVVEDGVWVGMGATILPGVRLGRGCVVSAGAVVSSDVPPNTLVAGNPATVVQELPLQDR